MYYIYVLYLIYFLKLVLTNQPSASIVGSQPNLPPLVTKRDNVMLNFINQEHITFLSNDPTNLPAEFKTHGKQISFILGLSKALVNLFTKLLSLRTFFK